MKKNKILKTLGLFGCAILLVAVSIAGTMAYMTSTTETVKNTFTAGNVKITLDEAKVTEYGVKDGDSRVTENKYKLLPGHEYSKDPTVHVDADSEDCWLFVKVENGIAAIEADTTIAAQMATKGWTLVGGETDVYAYNATASANADVVVFETFKLKGDANVDAYVSAQILVTAYAVQADGFDSASDAWAAAPAAWKTTSGN